MTVAYKMSTTPFAPFVPFGTYLLVGQLKQFGWDIPSTNKFQVNLSVIEIKSQGDKTIFVQGDHVTTVELEASTYPDVNYFEVSKTTEFDDHNDGTCVRSVDVDELGETISLKFISIPNGLDGEVICWVIPDQMCSAMVLNHNCHLVLRDRGVNRYKALISLKEDHRVVLIYKLPTSKRQIKQVTDLLIDRSGPALPRVLAELIVSYLV